MKILLYFALIVSGIGTSYASTKLSKILPGSWISEEYSAIFQTNEDQRPDKVVYSKVKHFNEESDLRPCTELATATLLEALVSRSNNSGKKLTYKAVDYYIFKGFFVEGYTNFKFAIEGEESSLSCQQMVYGLNFVDDQKSSISNYSDFSEPIRISILEKKKLEFNYSNETGK